MSTDIKAAYDPNTLKVLTTSLGDKTRVLTGCPPVFPPNLIKSCGYYTVSFSGVQDCESWESSLNQIFTPIPYDPGSSLNLTWPQGSFAFNNYPPESEDVDWIIYINVFAAPSVSLIQTISIKAQNYHTGKFAFEGTIEGVGVNPLDGSLSNQITACTNHSGRNGSCNFTWHSDSDCDYSCAECSDVNNRFMKIIPFGIRHGANPQSPVYKKIITDLNGRPFVLENKRDNCWWERIGYEDYIFCVYLQDIYLNPNLHPPHVIIFHGTYDVVFYAELTCASSGHLVNAATDVSFYGKHPPLYRSNFSYTGFGGEVFFEVMDEE